MDTTNRIFGRRLRVLRKHRHWTLEELGRKAGIGYKHVADIERGVKAPSFDAIDRIARALTVQPYELFLPSFEQGTDPELRLTDLLREFRQVDSPAIKELVIAVLDSARKMQGGIATGVTQKHRREKR